MKFTNVAIIGSNGFIGQHLTKKLQQIPGVNLSLFGRSTDSVFGDSLPYTVLDMNDNALINERFADIDIIYYLASQSIPASSWDHPTIDVRNNLLPFLNLIECVVQLKAKKIVFLSSAGTIYGPTKEKVTENSVKEPFSPHGIIKLTMEYFLNYFNKKYGLQYDIFRVANVYGEGQNTSKGLGIINTFLEHILTDGKIRIFGDGSIIRNYLYVKDLTDLLAMSLSTNAESSDIYNASSYDTLSINNLVDVIKKVVAEDFEIIYTENRKSDNSAIYLDNTHIVQANPDFVFTTIEEGIRKTYEHLKGA